jgi:hypothetical protein
MPASASDIIGVYDPIGIVKSGNTGNAFKMMPTSVPASVTFSSSGRANATVSFTICDTLHKLSDARRVDVTLSGYAALSKVDATTAASTCS